MKLNKQIFHDFFYDDIRNSAREQKAKSATKYIGNHFFSYNTTIGFIHRETERGPVLFVSDYGFSNTTRAHLGALRQASPFPLIEVPFDWDDDYTSFTGRETPELNARLIIALENRFNAYFATVDAQHIKYAARRREFIRKYENFTKFLQVTAPYKAPSPDLVLTYRNAVELDNARSGQRAAILERQKQIILEQLSEIAKLPLTDIIYRAFIGPDHLEQKTGKLYLKTKYPGGSFIWITGDKVRTSQGVSVPLATVSRIYKAYTAGKIKEGMHLDRYTIIKLDKDFVQIGCHKIYLDNINAIANQL